MGLTKQCCVDGFRMVTIEPLFLLYMIGSFLKYPAMQALIFTKVCMHKYDDTQFCDLISRNETFKEEEEAVQSETSLWIMYSNICLTVPSIITTAFIGSWADNIGRKLALIIPCVGALLSNVCYLLNALWPVAPLPYVLAGPLVNALAGSYIAMMMAAFSYITHVSSRFSRTRRVAVVEAMLYFAATLGTILSGILLDYTTFTFLFSLNIGLLMVAILYTVIWVQEPECTSDDRRTNAGHPLSRFRYLFNISHMVETVSCMFKRRHDYQRLHLWLLFLTGMILQLATTGVNDILLLYLKRPPLSWSYSLYGYLQGFHSLLRCLLLITVLQIVKKKLHLHDTSLAIWGLVSRIAGYVLLGLSGLTWMVFLVPVLSMFEGYSSAGCRSLMSTMVNEDEQGKMFGVLASGENVVSLLATVTFNNIYPATLDFYPGLSFQIIAGLCCLAIGILLVIRCQLRREQDYAIMSDPTTCGPSEDAITPEVLPEGTLAVQSNDKDRSLPPILTATSVIGNRV